MSTPVSAKPARGKSGAVDAFLAEAKRHVDAEDWAALAAAAETQLDRDPGCAPALFALGLARFGTQDVAEAVTLLQEALRLEGAAEEYAETLAVFYGLAGDLANATYYAKLGSTMTSSPAIKALVPRSVPNLAKVFQNVVENGYLQRGIQELAVRNWPRAEHWFRQHLSFFPTQTRAHLGCAMALVAQGQPRRAVEALRAARHALPADPQIAAQLGNLLATLGHFDEAAACHRHAGRLAPDDPAIHAVRLVDRLYDPDADPGRLAAEFRAWGERFGVRRDPGDDRPRPDRPTLTVGYVVGNQGSTPVGIGLSALIAQHGTRRFEVVGFGYGPLSSAANVVFQKAMPRWHDISAVDPVTLRAIVQAEEIDILVDASGFSAPKLLAAFGLRMAPMQVAWLDSPLGTGLAGFDAALTDAVLDPGATPSGLPAVRLKHGAIVAAPLPLGESAVPPAPEGEITFAADVNLMEINPRTVELWAAVMHQVAASKLILRDHGFKAEPESVARLIAMFGDFGLAHRVDIVEEPIVSTFFSQAHVALMPLPYPRPQIAVEALWGGAPAICLQGASRHGREAASLLVHLGFAEDMVAEDEDGFVGRAVAWASDSMRLAAFRSTIRDRLSRSPVLTPKTRIADLESAYEELWRRVQRGS